MTASCYQPNVDSYLLGFDTFVSNLGFIIYGLFTFMCVTVLINTLIAMLEGTIEDIDDRADIEWKFARSKLYMEYIRSGRETRMFNHSLLDIIELLGSTLPVPMNILPSPTSMMNLLHRIRRFIRNEAPVASMKDRPKRPVNHNSDALVFNNKGIFNRKQSLHTNKQLTYKTVIERVIKRFLLYYKDPRMGLVETKDALQIKEIRNDISALHFELSDDIDGCDELTSTMQRSVKGLNSTFSTYFDLEAIKQHRLGDRNKSNLFS